MLQSLLIRVRGDMSSTMSLQKKTYRIIVSAVIVFASFGFIFNQDTASAAQITTRSLTLLTGAGGDGGSMTSGVVNHEFTFTVPSVGNTNIGSIRFDYCTTAAGTCTMPTGLATDGGSTALAYENGATGFTLNKTVNGSPYLTRASSAVTAGTALTYRLSNITNPSTIVASQRTFFVRINTYTGTDGATGPVDSGTVAASTAEQIILTGTMPESLIFCAGATIGTTSTIPDCATATAGAVSFNQLFSPTDTATATSQLAASTNATLGYNITVNGETMKSGANTITAMAAPATISRGTGQFGMNLKLNTVATSTIAVGAEIAAASNGTDLRGQPLAGYNTVDTFKFVTGDSIANSQSGGAGPTNAQIYTVSYIVNVPGSQSAGTYTTTLTYVCTATF